MKDLDIFGNKFQFYHKGDDELKSKFGIILTVLYIICTGVATFLLGRNFLKEQIQIVLHLQFLLVIMLLTIYLKVIFLLLSDLKMLKENLMKMIREFLQHLK